MPAKRIDQLVEVALGALAGGPGLAEVGYDRGAIVLAALARRPDLRAVGVEIQRDVRLLDAPADVRARLEQRTGDGLAPLAAGEVDCVLIAGMGGRSIAEMLLRDPAHTRSFRSFVLSPSHLEADIRPALATLGLAIDDERLVRERDHFYEIITAARGGTAPPSDAVSAAWGPRLFARRDPLLPAFLADAKRRFAGAFAAGLRSYREGSKAALGRKLALLDEAIARAN